MARSTPSDSREGQTRALQSMPPMKQGDTGGARQTVPYVNSPCQWRQTGGGPAQYDLTRGRTLQDRPEGPSEVRPTAFQGEWKRELGNRGYGIVVRRLERLRCALQFTDELVEPPKLPLRREDGQSHSRRYSEITAERPVSDHSAKRMQVSFTVGKNKPWLRDGLIGGEFGTGHCPGLRLNAVRSLTTKRGFPGPTIPSKGISS